MILRRMTVFLLVLLLVAGLQAKVAEATQVKRVSMEGYIGKRVDAIRLPYKVFMEQRN